MVFSIGNIGSIFIQPCLHDFEIDGQWPVGYRYLIDTCLLIFRHVADFTNPTIH